MDLEEEIKSRKLDSEKVHNQDKRASDENLRKNGTQEQKRPTQGVRDDKILVRMVGANYA